MFDSLRVQHRSPEPSFDPRITIQAGEDGPPPDEPARARLRAEAVAWLRADLAALARRLDADGAAAAPDVAARSPTRPRPRPSRLPRRGRARTAPGGRAGRDPRALVRRGRPPRASPRHVPPEAVIRARGRLPSGRRIRLTSRTAPSRRVNENVAKGPHKAPTWDHARGRGRCRRGTRRLRRGRFGRPGRELVHALTLPRPPGPNRPSRLRGRRRPEPSGRDPSAPRPRSPYTSPSSGRTSGA